MSNDYRATLDSIGDWGGREEYAVRRWNTHVLPIITMHACMRDDDEHNDAIAYAADQAWQAFCAPGGSRAAVTAFRKSIQ